MDGALHDIFRFLHPILIMGKSTTHNGANSSDFLKPKRVATSILKADNCVLTLLALPDKIKIKSPGFALVISAHFSNLLGRRIYLLMI